MTKDETRVFAELVLVTLAPLDEDMLALVAPAVLRAASELAPSSAPLGVLVDLALLLVGAPVRLDLATARASSGLPTDDPRLKSAVLGVFDALVAPIATSATLTDVRDALARHPRNVAVDTAGVLVAEVIQRVLDLAGSAAADRAPRVAEVRKALGRPATEVLNKGAAGLLVTERRTGLIATYESLARSARRLSAPLAPSDVVVAVGAPHLRHRAARLALRHLAEAQAAIAKQLPAAILHRRSRGTDVSTREHDESTYPMGGFSSMTNVGSLENVVTSELALSSDGDIGEDLFAIRWATGELLYYMRDESVAHRRRVCIWMVLGPELTTQARVKDQDAPWQRIVLALGAIGAFVDRTATILRQEALTIRVVFPKGGGFEEERTLLSIRLADAIERGVVEIIDGTLEEARARALDDAKVADVSRIEVASAARWTEAMIVEVGPRARVREAGSSVSRQEAAADSVSSWADAVKALLVALP